MKPLAWKPILVTFAVSFVLGSAFGRWEYSGQIHRTWKDPEARRARVLKRFDSKLKLDAAQKKQVAAVLEEIGPEWQAVREEIRPKFDVLRKKVRQKIEPLLTPGQIVLYDQMEAERKARREKAKAAG